MTESLNLKDNFDHENVLKALNDSKTELEFAINAAELATWDLNPKTYKFTGNFRLKEWFALNYEEETDLAKAVNMISDQDRLRVTDAIQQALLFSSGGNFNVTYTIVHPVSGKERVVMARGKALFDDDNVVTRFNGILQDITDGKNKEAELLMINKRLGAALEEQKELQKQKDDFLGIASHELKTPVTTLKAYTQLLQRMLTQKGDLKEAEMMMKMDAQLNRLTNLIGDLLDVTKMNSGRLEFNSVDFDFNEMLHSVVEELQRTTERHTIIENFEKVGIVKADRERVGQVLTNLISNAIKYSPNHYDINVFSKITGQDIVVAVEDRGIGIPEDKKDKVFEQFYRVSGNMQHTFPGLGLGLYISSEIIKREGGRLWVSSAEGKGSTFYFSLPIQGMKNN